MSWFKKVNAAIPILYWLLQKIPSFENEGKRQIRKLIAGSNYSHRLSFLIITDSLFSAGEKDMSNWS